MSTELVVESSQTPAKPEDYVVVSQHRLVKPYHFDFACGVRQRWCGQNIVDIFAREFPARDRAYYLQALADGRLRVEGCQVSADTPLRDGMQMRHFIHRHEPPVPAGPIQVVGQSADAVAVCKPHGMPVHVAGQYRKNTVLGILTAERPDLGQLYPIHRLDKPVSGLLLFARSPAAAAALCAKIEGRAVDKVYVARVLGRFPASEQGQCIAVDVPLDWDPVANMASAVPGAPCGSARAEAAAAAAAGEQQAEQRQAEERQDGEQQGEQQQGQQEQRQQGDEQGTGGMDRQERKALQRQQRAKKASKAERQAAAAAKAAGAAKKPSRGAAKPALTEFRLLAVAPDGLTSLVECRPRTGRTHQIRVHLQHLGHPIANDSQYGGTYGGPLASRHMAQQLGVHWASGGQGQGEQQGAAAGATAGGGAAGECSKRPRLEGAAAGPHEQQQQQQQDSVRAVVASGGAGAPVAAGAAADGPRAAAAPAAGAAGGDVDAYAANQAFRSQEEYRLSPGLCDPLCIHCPYYAPRDYPLDLRPLWLHARSYSCAEDGWAFATELPDWAAAGWAPPLAQSREGA